MVSRREFIKLAGLSVATTAIAASPLEKIINRYGTFTTCRPSPEARKFVSQAVEEKIIYVKSKIKNDELGWLFENCFPNTLDTTVEFDNTGSAPDTFVITGDIHAMWLRDSSAQVWPYIPLARQDKKLSDMLEGVVNRQVKSILLDPYANAFNKNLEGSIWEKDITKMRKELHERKWEVDSLCYPVRLSFGFWKQTGNTNIFTKDWLKAAYSIYDTFKTQQRYDGNGPYKFERYTTRSTDTLSLGGYGYPVKPCGLVYSAFRPSDDACVYHFLIPSNFFAVKSLRQIAEIAKQIYSDSELATKTLALADEIEKAIYEYAVFDHPGFGKIFAYEVDGFGNRLFMDDSNAPGLLSLPFLDLIDVNDPVYQNTRRYVLSTNNPFFFANKNFEGIGGPHVGIDYIWPMSIIMRAFTTSDINEIKNCLNMLIKSHAGTGFMHESFHKDKPEDFTRRWFAWTNTLFGELIIHLLEKMPEALNV